MGAGFCGRVCALGARQVHRSKITQEVARGMDARSREETRRGLSPRARWRFDTSPVDYLLALAEAPAALPLVGKPLESLGSLTAMGRSA